MLRRYTLAFTYDGSSATTNIYIDGELQSSCGGFDTNPSNIQLTHFFIGASVWGESYVGGELGCFRVYNRALRSVSTKICCFSIRNSLCANIRYICMSISQTHNSAAEVAADRCAEPPKAAETVGQVIKSSVVDTKALSTVPSLLVFYPFNDTAGSSIATDYSGNGFHAAVAGNTRPIFTGGGVVLDAKQSQYLSVDSRVAPHFKAQAGSYSVTMSVLFTELQVWAPVFDFGVQGKPTGM